MPQTIILNSSNVVPYSNNTKFRFNFAKPITFKNSKVAIRQIVMPYSWFNITSTYGNNQFSVVVPYGASPTTQTISITIPNGFYTLADLNSLLQYYFIANGFYLVNSSGNNVYYAQFIYNTSAYKIEIDCFPVPTSLPSGWSYGSATSGWATLTLPTVSSRVPQIVFPATNSVGSVMGFSPQTFPTTGAYTTTQSLLSDTTPNLTPVNSVIVLCNLVNNPFSIYSNTLFSFTPNTTFGSNIDIQPAQEAYINVDNGVYTYLEMEFRDQNYNTMLINDPNLTVQFLIKMDGEE